MDFTERDFRDAVGLFATGVTVVTAEVEGARIGATVSSFNTVSLTPPLVLFSLARSAVSFARWKAARTFGVTILGEAQSDLSNRFARAGENKWGDLVPLTGVTGVPLLASGLASFECATYARYDGGDHEIVVGRVLAFSTAAGRPLLFFGGRYRMLDADAAITTPPQADIWLHGWPAA